MLDTWRPSAYLPLTLDTHREHAAVPAPPALYYHTSTYTPTRRGPCATRSCSNCIASAHNPPLLAEIDGALVHPSYDSHKVCTRCSGQSVLCAHEPSIDNNKTSGRLARPPRVRAAARVWQRGTGGRFSPRTASISRSLWRGTDGGSLRRPRPQAPTRPVSEHHGGQAPLLP